MPAVLFPPVLAAVYQATLRQAGSTPTSLLAAGITLFRAFDHTYFSVDTHRQILRRDQANNALIVRDETSDTNRFTGSSHNSAIRSWGGLYCSMQQQALVNEISHYVEANRVRAAAARGSAAPTPLPRSAVFASKSVIKIQTLGPLIAADLSPHNPYAMRFLDAVAQDNEVKSAITDAGRNGLSFWDLLNDDIDCSVARGIGLALAAHGFEALCAQTVRVSERSPLERGDNVIFFGHQGRIIPNLSVVEAYLFPESYHAPSQVAGRLEIYPVEF